LAEAWYRKALELFERLGYPPLRVDTLAQFGLLGEQREDFRGELIAFVAALGIALQYRLPVGRRIFADLRRLRIKLGAAAFADIWRSAIGNREELLKSIEEGGGYGSAQGGR
jgi:hypothetical protein